MDWQKDWNTFISNVCRDLKAGLSDHDLREVYCDRVVEWSGSLSELRQRMDGGLEALMEMPAVQVRFEDGCCGVADYLALQIDPVDVGNWRRVIPGSRVRFTTCFPKRPNVRFIVPIEWVDLGDGTGYMSLLTTGSRMIAIEPGSTPEAK